MTSLIRHDQVTSVGQVGGASLTIAVRSHDGAVVIAIRGELDIATAPDLRHVLRSHCVVQTTSIEVDLRALAFIDASGLGVLVECNNALDRDGRRLRVSHPSVMCEKIFRITGLDFLLVSLDEKEDGLGILLWQANVELDAVTGLESGVRLMPTSHTDGMEPKSGISKGRSISTS